MFRIYYLIDGFDLYSLFLISIIYVFFTIIPNPEIIFYF